MSVKIKKSVARFLNHQVAHRIKLLESALLEIHDLDNRMKMELLALNTLANPNDDEFCEEDCMTYMSAEEELLKSHGNFDDSNCDVKYELVDLNDDVTAYEASINKIDEQIQSIDVHQPQSCYTKGRKISALNTFDFLTGLINDRSLKLTSCLPYSSQSSLLSLSPEQQLRISKEFPLDNELKYRHYTSINDDDDHDDDGDFYQNSDSNSSSLIFDSNILKNSPNNNSITQLECMRHSDHYNGSSSVIRFMENVYIREEEDDDDNSISSDDGNNEVSMKKCTYIYIGLLSIVICIASILFYMYPMFISLKSQSSPSVHEQSLTSVQKLRTQNLTNQLSQEFQGQHKRLWAQIRSALESPFQHEYTNHQRQTTNERIPPVVLLIVNRCIHSIVNNQSKQHHSTLNHNENGSFHCFITRLGQLINHLYLSNSKNSCSIVKPHQLNSLNKQKFDQIKLDFDNQLDNLYQSGERCFHFISIDLLPIEIILLFHGYTDTENSIYSNAILIISLSKRFDVYESLNCTKKSEYILPGCQTASQFEHQINQYLRSLWNKYLGNEEVDALISRLTTNIIIFHTYHYHIQ
ncbi:unnamed protein product [Schistosoma spindalis]|nr:unnamed protein product [Schistosoma spindale]